MVKNKDDTSRMVMDYIYINSHLRRVIITRHRRYQIPCKSSMGKRYSAHLISYKAFFNIKVAADTRKYTAFIKKWGCYEWTCMPFGGKDSPAIWAKASDLCFKLCRDLIKYVDDFVIASRAENGKSDVDNHIIAVDRFFQCLAAHNLKVKLSKCSFFVSQVKFIGCIITPQGRQVDDEYVRKLLEFRHPQSPAELKTYLGSIEWISRYVLGLKKYVEPLRGLIKGKFTKKTAKPALQRMDQTTPSRFQSDPKHDQE